MHPVCERCGDEATDASHIFTCPCFHIEGADEWLADGDIDEVIERLDTVTARLRWLKADGWEVEGRQMIGGVLIFARDKPTGPQNRQPVGRFTMYPTTPEDVGA